MSCMLLCAFFVDIVNVGNAPYESYQIRRHRKNKLTLAPGICTLLK
jgi:hypothetical protein